MEPIGSFQSFSVRVSSFVSFFFFSVFSRLSLFLCWAFQLGNWSNGFLMQDRKLGSSASNAGIERFFPGAQIMLPELSVKINSCSLIIYLAGLWRSLSNKKKGKHKKKKNGRRRRKTSKKTSAFSFSLSLSSMETEISKYPQIWKETLADSDRLGCNRKLAQFKTNRSASSWLPAMWEWIRFGRHLLTNSWSFQWRNVCRVNRIHFEFLAISLCCLLVSVCVRHKFE